MTGPVRVATAGLIAVTAAGLVSAVLTVVAWGEMAAGDAIANLGSSVAALVYAALGLLIIRRAGNLIGWFLLAEGAWLGLDSLTSAWAVLGLARPGTLPAAAVTGVLSECSFVPVAMVLAVLLLLFPSGTLPWRRWRLAAIAGSAVAVLLMASVLVWPHQMALPAPGGVSAKAPNPLGLAAFRHGPVAVAGSSNTVAVVFILMALAAIVSLVFRYRAGRREVRQQIKWLALTAGAAAVSLAIAQVAVAASHGGNQVSAVAYTVVTVIIQLGIPAAITLAILRYGLYEIDVIINRAIQYGLLSAVLTGVYAAIVVGIGALARATGSTVLTVAAAVAVALLFQPVRTRAQRVANRLVYGERATPYQVLADFAQDMAGQREANAVLDRMTAVLAGATGAVRVGVWLRVGAELRPHVTWPAGADAAPAAPVLLDDADGQDGAVPGELPELGQASRSVAVRHSGELLGALTVLKPRNEPVTPAEDKLLTHLASQAGLVLRNVRLTAELQATIDDLLASRRRLVQAQDDERRRIERNLHDGAQQQLIALKIQLSLLGAVADDPAEIRQLAGQLSGGLTAALEDLRALARGIYPPLLAEQGLAAALRAQAGRAALPVEVTAEGVGRYPRETEAAVYFCILEALQNTAKYAGASRAIVTLACRGRELEFRVTDDGAGFDTGATSYGTGLQGMTDRLAAVGGRLMVRSGRGQGTTVTGRLPAAELVAGQPLAAPSR